MKRCLVTGAAWFIGSHVVRALLDDGHRVRALHLPREDLTNLEGLAAERFAGDVTDEARMAEAMRDIDWVFHLAAIYALWLPEPARMFRVNVDGTRVVLAAAERARVARVVHTSSIARFGGQGLARAATEASPFALGVEPYARSKAEAHAIAEDFARRGLDVVIVAPTGPIGPGDIGPTPTGRLLLTSATLPIAVVTKSSSCFGDVRDMARAHVLAAERGRKGESYLLGARDASLRELAHLAHAALGRRRPVIEVPIPLARLGARAALAWTQRVSHRAPLVTPAAVEVSALGLRASCDKARRELGAPTRPLEESVRDALGWWSCHGHLPRRLHA